jgi:RNA polymerase sigma-70 factor (ECF subfamily)
MTQCAPDEEVLASTFAAARAQLRAVAFRMLGSLDEADDAVQETWLRACRSELQAIRDLSAWLTTVVSRVCLDILRVRRRRAEELLDVDLDGQRAQRDPEAELLWVESVGSALLVVLDTLGPAERIAFVLHDLLGQPFEQIAQVVDRTPVAAKKLASRARARVLARPAGAPAVLARERSLVEAFLAACRAADPDRIAALLLPDTIRRNYPRGQASVELRGSHSVAREALSNTKSARIAELVAVDGSPGLIVAPRGRLAVLLRFTIMDSRIAVMEVITDAPKLRQAQIRLFELC